MKKLRIGIVGVGSIALVAHICSYNGMEDVEIVAVSDIVPEKMNYDQIPATAKKYADYREMLEKESLDAVDICTPNDLHSKIAVYALEHGKHVFCEKPDAISFEERKRMSAAQQKSGKVLMVMRNNRHTAGSLYLKKCVDAGEFGEIYAGRCGWIRRRGIPGKGGWFTTKSRSGCGPLIDLGVHMLDLAIYLMGNPKAVAVSGSTYCKFAEADDISDSEHSSFGEKKEDGIFDVEDLATGFIRFENGASLQVEFSWASNIEEESRFVELRGTKGGCTWKDEQVKVFNEKNGALVDVVPKLGPANGHRDNLRHFVNVVLYGEAADFDNAQGENMVKILEAIYRSAKEGKEVRL